MAHVIVSATMAWYVGMADTDKGSGAESGNRVPNENHANAAHNEGTGALQPGNNSAAANPGNDSGAANSGNDGRDANSVNAAGVKNLGAANSGKNSDDAKTDQQQLKTPNSMIKLRNIDNILQAVMLLCSKRVLIHSV